MDLAVWEESRQFRGKAINDSVPLVNVMPRGANSYANATADHTALITRGINEVMKQQEIRAQLIANVVTPVALKVEHSIKAAERRMVRHMDEAMRMQRESLETTIRKMQSELTAEKHQPEEEYEVQETYKTPVTKKKTGGKGGAGMQPRGKKRSANEESAAAVLHQIRMSPGGEDLVRHFQQMSGARDQDMVTAMDGGSCIGKWQILRMRM